MPFNWIRNILRADAFTGVLLLAMAVLALAISNSPYSVFYHEFFASTALLGIPLKHSFIYWVNHGLMALFFLNVGLEIKAEILEGDLNTVRKALLPGIAALGGMCIPALIFLLINRNSPHYWPAWSVPLATDIAFSLAVLQLFGKKIPVGLKLFLLALAIFDDLGAIVIIAIFYTHQLHLLMLEMAVLVFLLLWAFNFFHINKLRYYLLAGVVLWYLVAQAGIDAAITGVFVAFCVPLRSQPCLLRQLYERLHPWVTYGILPLFALANSGVSFGHADAEGLFSTLAWGIIAGLVLGKPLGVFLFSYLAVKLNLARLPTQINWRNLFGVSLFCGIGFTMSLLLGDLAFQHANFHILSEVKAAILTGSFISAVLGYTWFYFMVKYDKTK
ncbi:MAG: nhaA [Gammaproteobacteria bacterium]|jgi:NhaA family Na+:H+ antiporter|nr:nhaA [Gammaproteobacteria bacterium]